MSVAIAAEAARASSATSSIAAELSDSVTRVRVLEVQRIHSAITSQHALASSRASAMSDQVAAESSRALGEEASIASRLSSEVSRASVAHVDLHSAISLEVKRAKSVEDALSTSVVDGSVSSLSR